MLKCNCQSAYRGFLASKGLPATDSCSYPNRVCTAPRVWFGRLGVEVPRWGFEATAGFFGFLLTQSQKADPSKHRSLLWGKAYTENKTQPVRPAKTRKNSKPRHKSKTKGSRTPTALRLENPQKTKIGGNKKAEPRKPHQNQKPTEPRTTGFSSVSGAPLPQAPAPPAGPWRKKKRAVALWNAPKENKTRRRCFLDTHQERWFLSALFV